MPIVRCGDLHVIFTFCLQLPYIWMLGVSLPQIACGAIQQFQAFHACHVHLCIQLAIPVLATIIFIPLIVTVCLCFSFFSLVLSLSPPPSPKFAFSVIQTFALNSISYCFQLTCQQSILHIRIVCLIAAFEICTAPFMIITRRRRRIILHPCIYKDKVYSV